jgi:RNA 3'-terminal phosphate cyclase
VVLCEKKYIYYLVYNDNDLCRIGVETTTGCLLAANALGKRGISAFDVGIKATEELLQHLSHRACVDRYLEDQVSVFI